MIQNAWKVLTFGFLLASLGLGGCNGASSEPVSNLNHGTTGFMIKQLPSDGRAYGLFIPLAYTPRHKWPVIIFLHGIGEGGSDPRSCMKVGLGPAVYDQQTTFPFIVIFAQTTGSWDENSDAARDVIAALDQVERDYSVDETCVTLTGLSTGGYGTWAIGAKYKDRFSALVPMAAYSDHKDVNQLTDMPIWCFHNTLDPFVLAAGSRSMCDGIDRRGGTAKYSEFFAPGHDCWSKVYTDGELFAWMQAQHKTGRMARRNSIPAPAFTPAAPASTVAVRPPARTSVSTARTPVPLDPPAMKAYRSTPAAPMRMPAQSDDSSAVPTPY